MDGTEVEAENDKVSSEDTDNSEECTVFELSLLSVDSGECNVFELSLSPVNSALPLSVVVDRLPWDEDGCRVDNGELIP